MERRFSQHGRLSLTRADNKQRIAGYAARYYDGTDATEFELYRYGNERCVERIMPGAFTRAIRFDDVRALFNHDPSAVLGRTKAGTLTLSDDADGLGYSIDPPDTQLARDLMASIARGDITGSSFSFEINNQSFSESRQADGGLLIVRHVEDAILGDVGPVTYPAYGGASVGVRSANAVDYRPLVTAWRERCALECQAMRAVPLPARLAAITARARQVD